ncbi:MAG TPA: hypothetical protein VLG47_00890 [Candidatus Saccharimonadales bacterium]|nr:hypothetical protein [Candidatus Saccharimonadales bacterium]
MKDIIGGPTDLPPNFLEAYLVGNQRFPQANAGLMTLAGSHAIGKILSGALTVDQFAAMDISVEQLQIVDSAAIRAHHRFGIPCRPARSANEAQSGNMHYYSRERLHTLGTSWIMSSLWIGAEFAVAQFPDYLPALPAGGSADDDRNAAILQAAKFLLDRRPNDEFRPEAKSLLAMWRAARGAVHGDPCRGEALAQRRRMTFMYAHAASDTIWSASQKNALGIVGRLSPFALNAVSSELTEIRAATGVTIADQVLHGFVNNLMSGCGQFHRPVCVV